VEVLQRNDGVVAEMFKWVFAHGIERINLSAGQDQSKTRWKPNKVLFCDACKYRRPCGRKAFGFYRAYEVLRAPGSRQPFSHGVESNPSTDHNQQPATSGRLKTERDQPTILSPRLTRTCSLFRDRDSSNDTLHRSALQECPSVTMSVYEPWVDLSAEGGEGLPMGAS
jgi:hypothetical protein